MPVAEARLAAARLAAGRHPGSVPDPEASAFRSLVEAHGLGGLAVRALDDGPLDLSDGVAEGVRADWLAARRWAAALDLELQRIGRRVLAERGLSPPILLKGPAVARWYADQSVRSYGDLDVLVPSGEVARWSGVLASLGYVPPDPWLYRNSLRFKHHVVFRRSTPTRDVLCEVHTRIFMERRARSIGYRPLVSLSEPSPFPGLRWCRAPAQLVVLALHLLHHRSDTRRLIWRRDLIELGDRATVAAARALADRLGVRWAVERALWGAERLLGEARWGAAPPPRARFDLVSVLGLGDAGHLYQLARARDLGPVEGVRYLLSRVDPRRFTGAETGSRWGDARAWIQKHLAQASATPWHRGLHRR
jgi:alkylated DNA nucleotide flippase Atl1